MKRLFAFLIVCFIGFIIYFDVTTGSLPKVNDSKEAPAIPVQSTKNTKLTYKETVINRGDTLLSILEKQEGGVNVPIDTLITDFQELNEGLKPEQMQIGKSYKIPTYKK